MAKRILIFSEPGFASYRRTCTFLLVGLVSLFSSRDTVANVTQSVSLSPKDMTTAVISEESITRSAEITSSQTSGRTFGPRESSGETSDQSFITSLLTITNLPEDLSPHTAIYTPKSPLSSTENFLSSGTKGGQATTLEESTYVTIEIIGSSTLSSVDSIATIATEKTDSDVPEQTAGTTLRTDFGVPNTQGKGVSVSEADERTAPTIVGNTEQQETDLNVSEPITPIASTLVSTTDVKRQTASLHNLTSPGTTQMRSDDASLLVSSQKDPEDQTPVSTPSSGANQTTLSESPTRGSKTTAAVVGVCFGVVLITSALVSIVFILHRRRKRRKQCYINRSEPGLDLTSRRVSIEDNVYSKCVFNADGDVKPMKQTFRPMMEGQGHSGDADNSGGDSLQDGSHYDYVKFRKFRTSDDMPLSSFPPLMSSPTTQTEQVSLDGVDPSHGNIPLESLRTCAFEDDFRAKFSPVNVGSLNTRSTSQSSQDESPYANVRVDKTMPSTALNLPSFQDASSCSHFSTSKKEAGSLGKNSTGQSSENESIYVNVRSGKKMPSTNLPLDFSSDPSCSHYSNCVRKVCSEMALKVRHTGDRSPGGSAQEGNPCYDYVTRNKPRPSHDSALTPFQSLKSPAGLKTVTESASHESKDYSSRRGPSEDCSSRVRQKSGNAVDHEPEQIYVNTSSLNKGWRKPSKF